MQRWATNFILLPVAFGKPTSLGIEKYLYNILKVVKKSFSF